jgi:hypothetical protein
LPGLFTNFKIDVEVLDSYMLLVNYEEVGSQTRSLVLAQSDFPGLEELGALLVESQGLLNHPILLPTLLSSLVIDFAVENLTKCDSKIADLEVQTGQDYNYKGNPVNPLGLNFTDATRTLNTIGRVLGKSQRSIKAVMFQLRKYQNCVDGIKQKSCNKSNISQQCDCLYERIENLRSRCDGLLLHLEFNATRVQNLLSAVCALVHSFSIYTESSCRYTTSRPRRITELTKTLLPYRGMMGQR